MFPPKHVLTSVRYQAVVAMFPPKHVLTSVRYRAVVLSIGLDLRYTYVVT